MDKIKEVEAFLDYELRIQVPIEDVFTIGQGNPPQAVITFQNQQDKYLVLNNKERLKGVLNDQDKPIYINEHYPMALSEKKRREREIRAINKRLDTANKAEIEFEQGKMKINGAEYKKKIREPLPEDILSLDETEFNATLNMQISKPTKTQEKDSTFYAYTASVTTHQEIQKLYTKVRIMHAKARHVICAFNILGDEFYIDCDGCDDQEYGASKNIVRLLQEQDITSRVIFVVRYCGEQKLNARRFEIYLEMAKLVIAQNPKNTITGQMQYANKEVNKTPMQPPRTSEWASRGAKRGGQRQGRGRIQTRNNRGGGSRHINAAHRYAAGGGTYRRRRRQEKRQRTFSEESGRVHKQQWSQGDEETDVKKLYNWQSSQEEMSADSAGLSDDNSQTG